MEGLTKRGFYVASFALLHYFAVVSGFECPDEQSLQLGLEGIVECNIPFQFVRVCWFKGTSLQLSPPLVCLEGGKITSSKTYGIEPKGSLLIIKTRLSQEGIFTVVAFHPNGTYQYSSVNVKVIAYPKPKFPVISLCSGKHNCSVQADDNGSVECTVYGARPAVEVDLLSDEVTLSNVIRHNVLNESTGLTDTTVKAHYKLECAPMSNIICTSTVMQEVMSTLTFHDNCSLSNSTGGTEKVSGGAAVVITSVIIVIIVVIVVSAIATYCKLTPVKRKRGKQRRTDLDYERIKQADPVERGDGKGNKENTNQVEVKQNIKTEKKQKENVEGACIIQEPATTTGAPSLIPTDCYDVCRSGSTDGVYTIQPTGWTESPFDVYCDMSHGGGWTVLQRRVDGSVSFNRTWEEYKTGFGSAGQNENVWLGNEKLYHMTNQKNYSLRIDVATKNYSQNWHMIYDLFRLKDENDNYQLELGKFTGNTGYDYMEYHRNEGFSTPDQDNDHYFEYNNQSCAKYYHAGWWWNPYVIDADCYDANLNGVYDSYFLLFHWPTGYYHTLQYSQMKIRPI